jgi:hypothetical protein
MHPTQNPASQPDLSPEFGPAEVLRSAALYLRRHGLHQGDMFAHPIGLGSAACAQGAVKMAICGNPHGTYTDHDVVLFDETMTVLAEQVDCDFNPWDDDANTPWIVVADWNDAEGRTVDQVVTAMTEAADQYDTYQARITAAHTNIGGAR